MGWTQIVKNNGGSNLQAFLGAFFWVQRKKAFKPSYLKITFGTNMTFLQNTAELLGKVKLVIWIFSLTNLGEVLGPSPTPWETPTSSRSGTNRFWNGTSHDNNIVQSFSTGPNGGFLDKNKMTFYLG